MSRTRTGAALALLALALLALPAESSGDSSDPTWAGEWDSDFGLMTLDASGSGSYHGFSDGTISGSVDGRNNEGTWKQSTSSGTFAFTMSASGLSFTGVWEYDQGGCGSACGWNGTCVDGPCVHNDDPEPNVQCQNMAERALLAEKTTCKLGSLPFGSEVSVPGPSRGETVDISPKPVKATAEQVLAAIQELLLEEEEAEILAALSIEFGGGTDVEDALSGCVLLGEDIIGGRGSVGSEKRAALYRACGRLLVDQARKPAAAGSAAANGCEAVFVPAFPKDRTVTKRMRKHAVAAMRKKVAVSCKQRRVGRLKLSLRARGEGATVADTVGRRLHVEVARRVPRGAPEQRLGVRWRAR